MPIRTDVINDLFARLGGALQKPTRLCLIGSTPAIAIGQKERQTSDIDIWFPKSGYDTGDLARACRETGVLLDPISELDSDKIYLQIIRPGIIRLPAEFEPEIIGVFGNLTVLMPPPELLAASKLVRGNEVDVQDVVWWINRRRMDAAEIMAAIRGLPREADRETAGENMLYVNLVLGRLPK